MAQVTTTDIRTRLKNMILADSTISTFTPTISVFDKAPMALTRSYLPAILITDGSGTYDTRSLGQRYLKVTLTFTIALYMQEWSANPDRNITETGIDLITTAIEDLTTLNFPMIYNGSSLKGVSSAHLSNVTSISARPYPINTEGALYVHKQWTYQVTYERKT